MTTYATEQYLIAMLNMIFCVVSGFICVCRLNSMQRSERPVRFLVLAEYACGVGAMVFSALRPLIDEWPGYASLAVAGYILISLLASGKAWRGDTPPVSATRPPDFYDQATFRE